MKTEDIKAYLTENFGNNAEIKDRWPDINPAVAKNWSRIAKYHSRSAKEDEGWPDYSLTEEGKGISPFAIVRHFILKGSDRFQVAVVTDPADEKIIFVDDSLGD